jgi:hypothetical protein
MKLYIRSDSYGHNVHSREAHSLKFTHFVPLSKLFKNWFTHFREEAENVQKYKTDAKKKDRS